MFLSAFAPAYRTYYDHQRARGIFAMVRDGTFYEPRTPEPATTRPSQG